MLNTTGTLNTDEYSLGRGIIYLAALDADGFPGVFRDVGNANEFNTTIETERLEHQSSRTGLRVVDKEIVVSQQLSLTITLDSINFQNLALFFSGGTNSAAAPATTATAATLYQRDTGFFSASDVPFWFDLFTDRYNATPDTNRIYDLATAALAMDLEADDGTAQTTLIAGTDIIYDESFGRVFVTATGIAKLAANGTSGADRINLPTGDALATDTPMVDEVEMLTQTQISTAVKFISENPAASGQASEAQFHKVTLAAEGDLSLIGDDFSTIQLSGSAERNTDVSTTNPFGYVRTFAGAVPAAAA